VFIVLRYHKNKNIADVPTKLLTFMLYFLKFDID
jgi:hypothetical protein